MIISWMGNAIKGGANIINMFIEEKNVRTWFATVVFIYLNTKQLHISITSCASIPLVEQPVAPEGSSATEVEKKYAKIQKLSFEIIPLSMLNSLLQDL